MAQPTAALADTRSDLRDSFVEFDLEMDQRGFIAHRVLPVLEVGQQGGSFGKIPIEELLLERDTTRGPRGEYNRGQWKFTPDTFATEEHGWEEPIDDREKAMYATFFDMEVISTLRALDTVLRNHERRTAAALFNATTWTATSVGTEWSTVATATPVTNVASAKKAVWDACGLHANALIINKNVFNNLRRCAEVVDASKAQPFMDVRQRSITEAALSFVFDLDHILVAGGATNSANAGQAASIASIWSDEYAMVARVATTNDIREACVGRTFHWGEDGSDILGTIETYQEAPVRGDIVRARHDVQEKILYVEAAELLDNITA